MVDRRYFAEIGLLDEGMEVYGGENVELGIRVRLFSMCESGILQNWVLESFMERGGIVTDSFPTFSPGIEHHCYVLLTL